MEGIKSRKRIKDNLKKKKTNRAFTWGPFLSDRQWGTVREDRTSCRDSWRSLSFKESMNTSYWHGEDGLFGICDPQCRICFSYCFYNGKDDCVKEKLFGLGSVQGNHGEDVKEVYFYRTNTVSHEFMTATYMYPMRSFPYEELTAVNSKRGLSDDEFEIWDSGCFEDGWWDLEVVYNNRTRGEVINTLRAKNCSNRFATLSVIPTVWFKNIWSSSPVSSHGRPSISIVSSSIILCQHPDLGFIFISVDNSSVQFVVTENESCLAVEDAQPRAFADKCPGTGEYSSSHQVTKGTGTKCYAVVTVSADPGKVVEVRTRILMNPPGTSSISAIPRTSSHQRRAANQFYDRKLSWVPSCYPEIRRIFQFALSGLLWNKQYYQYNVAETNRVRALKLGKGAVWNTKWKHLDVKTILSMPDKWEFPWFASWDLCLQMIPFAEIDPLFAQNQLRILLSSNLMAPDGQLPGCEYNFDDPNPPFQGFAVLHVFHKTMDWKFLRESFPRLRLSLQWWWNRRKQHPDRNDEFKDGIFFSEGFLGLDNISVIDRSQVPSGCQILQCDAFSWVFLLALNCLEIALLLHSHDGGFPDTSPIIDLMKMLATLQRSFKQLHDGVGCDLLLRPDGSVTRLRIKSYVGLSPLLASRVLKSTSILRHCLQQEPSLRFTSGKSTIRISLVTRGQTEDLLRTLCEEDSLLGPFGIRSLSKKYEKEPFEVDIEGETMKLQYWPGESMSRMFGGNSNWRGPVWIPMNFLFIDALSSLSQDSADIVVTSEGFPTTIDDVWRRIAHRVLGIFLLDSSGKRPVHGNNSLFARDGPWGGAECVLFYEYFHGDTGRGCGASHQTGWTALITNIGKLLFKC